MVYILNIFIVKKYEIINVDSNFHISNKTLKKINCQMIRTQIFQLTQIK